MRVLFDQGVPTPLRGRLAGWDIKTAFELGWSELENGALLSEAERAGFSIFLTTDKNLKYQQRLTGRQIAIVVLSTTSWPRIERQADEILKALNAVRPGDYVEVAIA